MAAFQKLGFVEMKSFRTQTYGKWILAGEHAVLRGCPALAFPLLNRTLDLSFTPTSGNFNVEFLGPHGAELNLLFYGVIENALHRLKVTESLKGKFSIFNAIPVGAGLGASAALCGAIARWCEAQDWVASEQVYEFARRLEDLFHGESSGVDLAVSLSGHGIHFVRGGERRPLVPHFWPQLYLSYSGHRGMTSDCVAQVKDLYDREPSRAERLDGEMRRSVEMAELALLSESEQGFDRLADSIRLARSCFEQWGLMTFDLVEHIRKLENAGAVAVKPTGSGGGGFVLSLWRNSPPESMSTLLVPVPRPSSAF